MTQTNRKEQSVVDLEVIVAFQVDDDQDLWECGICHATTDSVYEHLQAYHGIRHGGADGEATCAENTLTLRRKVLL